MQNRQPGQPDTDKPRGESTALDKIVKIVTELSLPFRKKKKNPDKTIYPLF